MRLKVRGRSGQAGFTLVELMVTMLILGILVGIAVMTMSVSRSKAQQAACKANLRTIYDAVQVYQSVHNATYPPTLDDLVTDGLMKSSFTWTCPAGPLGTISTDYRDYYDSAAGHTSCPRVGHNP